MLPDGHTWLRIADPGWADPLDPTFAAASGQRWNPPNSFPVLYVNEDVVTARLNLRRFIAGWPFEPEDLRDDTGPLLVSAVFPAASVSPMCVPPPDSRPSGCQPAIRSMVPAN